MRVFLALGSEQLQSSVIDQWVQQTGLDHPHLPADRHMTLMFLGEQPTDIIHELTSSLSSLFSRVALPCVTWHASFVGDFPPQKPKVWAIQGGADSDIALWAAPILKEVQSLQCCTRQEGSFIPHVTLSYINQFTGLNLPVDWTIEFDQLVLCRSYTQEERAEKPQLGSWAKVRYEVLARWGLEKK